MNTPKDVLIVNTKDEPALAEFFKRLKPGDKVQIAPKGTEFSFTEFADDVARLDISEIAFKGMPNPEDVPVSVKAIRSQKDEEEPDGDGAEEGPMPPDNDGDEPAATPVLPNDERG